jgi:16S rRNA (adenine(1408)-N(1))-methyltransferase
LGSGDGRGPYHWAVREPRRLFIASDANPSSLEEIAWRAGRKPARGGVSNLLCIGEPLDVLANELGAVADRISVILPWGSLLQAVGLPELDSLRHIARLCLPRGTVEIVFSYDQQQDAREGAPLDTIVLDEKHITMLSERYALAGFEIVSTENIPQRQLTAYETTWAKRLAFGRRREVWRICARGAGKNAKRA